MQVSGLIGYVAAGQEHASRLQHVVGVTGVLTL
jgi:hypothetical protein